MVLKGHVSPHPSRHFVHSTKPLRNKPLQNKRWSRGHVTARISDGRTDEFHGADRMPTRPNCNCVHWPRPHTLSRVWVWVWVWMLACGWMGEWMNGWMGVSGWQLQSCSLITALNVNTRECNWISKWIASELHLLNVCILVSIDCTWSPNRVSMPFPLPNFSIRRPLSESTS